MRELGLSRQARRGVCVVGVRTVSQLQCEVPADACCVLIRQVNRDCSLANQVGQQPSAFQHEGGAGVLMILANVPAGIARHGGRGTLSKLVARSTENVTS